MFEQILSSSNIRNIWRTVWRTWILIQELKGLKLIYPWISTYLSLSRLCNLWYFRRFFIDYASRYNVRKKGEITPLCNIRGPQQRYGNKENSSLQQNLQNMLCIFETKVNLCCSKWHKFHVWCDTHIILCSQKSVFTQLAKTWFVARHVWMWVSKCTT